MKPNELRAGNWIVTKPDALFSQNQRMDINEHSIANFTENFDPIPLDDLILFKCTRERRDFIQRGNGADYQPEYPKTVGYDYIISDDIKICWHAFHWLDSDLKVRIDKPQYAVYFNGNYIRTVEYMHTLQNLIYTLTDEELVITGKL